MYFLATPHSGSDSAKLLSNILNITYSSRAYVSDLKRGSDAIRSINNEFSRHSEDIDLWSFYETQKLSIGLFRVLIVDPASATLGYRKEKQIPLNADHRSICKFEAPSDPNYILIRNALASTIKSAAESAQKWKERLLRSNINDLGEYLDVSDKFEDDLMLVQDVRLPGTCEWIKSKESHLEWQYNDNAARVLWLFGKPGSGKSVLSGYLVSQLRMKHEACSFFFFKHGDRSKSQLSTCLRSLAFQMACVNTEIRQLLLEMRERDVKLDGDDDRILWRRLFTSGIFKTNFQRHYWVIDALDECADLVSFFEIVLARLDRSVTLKILVTSRQTSEIERRIAMLGHDQVRAELISTADTKEDIASLVRARANALIVGSEAGRAALAERILGKSEGSWLWTVLVLNELSDSHSEEEIRHVLAEVPKGMEDLYLRTLDLMSQSTRGKRLIKAILVWATSVTRPLTVKELEEALNLAVNDIFPRLRESISALCGQLVAIDKFDRVQMVHETAREFLLNNSLNSEFAIDQTDAHTRIARACLAYLTGEEMRPPRTNRRSVSRSPADKRSKFSSYASLHFSYHLMKANPLADDLLDLLDKFLKTNVFSWIEAVARNRNLMPLIRTARNLKVYLKACSSQLSPLATDLQRVQGWIMDLIKISGKFSGALISQPSAVYSLIPPFCPLETTIHKNASAGRKISVIGMSNTSWDDRLSCIAFHQGQTSALCHGHEFFVVGLSTGQIFMYYTTTCQEYKEFDHGEAVMFLQFGTKADVLASCGFKKLLVWDIQNGHIIYNFEVPLRPIGLTFDEGFLIIPTYKNYLASWDLNNNGARQPDRPWNDTGNDKCTRSWRVPSVISISSGHRMLAVAYSGRPIALWDLEENIYYGSCGKKLSDGRTSTHPVTVLVFNPNPAIDLLVASYLDGELVLLNPFEDQTLESRRANCHTLASSADGRLLAGSAGFGAIHIYEFDTLTLLYQVQSSDLFIKQLSFSIDNLHCVDIRGSQCNVWEPPVLLGSSAGHDTSENSSQSFIEAKATDSKVKISAIAVHYDRDVVLCGRDDGSVSLYDAKTGSRKLEICRHNSSVRILEWWTQHDLAISVDVSNKILAWYVRKPEQGGWFAERMAFQSRLEYGGSITQVLTSEATGKFILSTRGSDHLWQVDGHEENSRKYTDWAPVRKWVQHPRSAYHAICFESTAARVYSWDKWSQVVSVSLDISVRELDFKSIRQFALHSAKGVLVELCEFGGSAKTQNLYLLDAQSFEADNEASFKDIVTVPQGLDDGLASLSEDGGQGGESLVSPVEPRLALLSQKVAHVIGICESSRLVFLDTGSWVCSVRLENRTPEITSYSRHFFIPYDWATGSRDVICAVLRRDILFARNDDLVIIRGGFDFTTEISLQEVLWVKKASALLREVQLQIGDANHPETDSIPDLVIEVATAMTIVDDPLDHRHRGAADRPTEIVTARDIVHPDTVGVEATVAAAALISNELRDFYYVEGLEEVRVIRDRQTKKSRQLGFLRFRNLDFARDFMDRNFPSIYLHGPNAGNNDKGTKVRVAYSREREDRTRARAESDWTCKMCAIVNYSTRNKCFRCQAPRPEAGPAGPPGIAAPKVENNGDNDAAPDNQPSQFLLFRGLESSVTEELLAKGVAKLYRPTPGSGGPSENQRKGAKVASTTGDANLGARDGSIRRVLLVRDRKTNESWRYGFAEFATVQDAQAAVARLHSFEKFTISSKPVLVSYIHAGVFVPVINPSASTDQFTFSPLSNPSLKLMYWDEEAYVKELTVSTAELDNNQASTAQGQAENQGKSSKEAEKAKKRKADAAASAASKKVAVPSHLQFWSNRHAELHGIQKKDADEKGSDGGVESRGSPADAAAPPTQSYADLNRNCCYLCMRQFKSSAEVNRHERLSQLHRDNLQNDELKNKAMGKLIKHGIVQSTPEYRDRARERRKAFGSSRTSTKAKPAAPREEDEPPVETTSKGASLLSKMGWSAGSGLGAQGTGMTAPIATEVYAQGVGLGAQGSKLGDAVEEAGRNTRNRYDEFLEKTRQTARERYERMEK
ncbi:hypothetical protein CNMCM8694_002812 [Aspergillus lentulus]|nr:hypothetical protein CNMCM8060_006733 [Aspergillus lentulus]KAF4179115.1 hypothetical protein CNMCM7927_002098 [Aspergillus lentulus]KAF4190891.1 hypothetical protein CNMCM8694_002812 [Aspergillus lentulus]